MRDCKKILNAERQDFLQAADAGCLTECKLLPPLAPHSGSLWEAWMKSAKHRMKRTIGNHVLSFDGAQNFKLSSRKYFEFFSERRFFRQTEKRRIVDVIARNLREKLRNLSNNRNSEGSRRF